ncbi:helix-turn-helix domain-containing protein [Candidatus Enterococcus ferrettii]|uniref:OmpR/PhoB-type domain-containing protein n=1 Tax=Candidatus Enterococcus ferrettii TaxID=2815324 RepID=A0ABV0ENV5_9ENTE|nr:winged helix-turn-helix domain-containing protein [Enterococcus sp. 665A]MBO1342862.1 response regulator transcription factor [Enterococcus sp. 665A]
MQQILLLTKNVLSEERLQRNLQVLNYEVFGTSSFLELNRYSQINEQFLEYFQFVILSKTVSNEEIYEILPTLKRHKLTIIRVFEAEPTEKGKAFLEDAGIKHWIIEDSPSELLREKMQQALLSDTYPTTQGNNESDNGVPFNRQKVEIKLANVIKHLSKQETEFFKIIFSAMSQPVTREELCERLWGDKTTNSHLSTLSSLSKRIEQKFNKNGFPGSIVKTQWGDGYTLSNEFSDQVAAIRRSPEIVTHLFNAA